MKRAHRLVVFGAVGVGLATLVAAGVVFVPIALEWIYLPDLASPDEARRRNAAQVLGSIGSRRAVPILIDHLPSHGPHDPTHYAHRALVRIGAPAVGPLVDLGVAAVVLEIGPPAIPTLVEKLRWGTRTARRTAAWILTQIGEQPSRHLVALLEEVDPEILEHALEALATLGPGASIHAPRITALVDHESERVRREALSALEKIGASRETIPSRVASDLGHADVRTRANAVLALGKLAKPGRFLPQLLEALDDPHHHVRCIAVGVLGRLGGEAREAVPLLARNLNRCTHHDELVGTVEALRSMGAEAETVPALARVLRGELFADMDSSVRGSAAGALGSIGSASPEATGALVAALKDPVPGVRLRAVHALTILGATDSIPSLIDLLARAETRGDLQISAQIIAAFEKMDPAARVALSLLQEIAKDEKAPARDLAQSLVDRWSREPASPGRRR